MIQRASAEHDIEASDRLGTEVLHVNAVIFDLALVSLASKQKRLKGVGSGPGIHSEHPLGAAAFELNEK